MKTFKDLLFTDHGMPGATKSSMHFDNGYGISVISGDMFYTTDSEPYEVAVLHDGGLCYSTDITDDVIGYQTEEGVTDIMKQVQNLKS